MRTLIYKRTHKGDPDRIGRFGINDCMGSVRSWDFDAVIGVGGIGSEARTEGIAGMVNWIGVGSRKGRTVGRGPLVTFDRFVLFEEKGADFRVKAPTLAERIYSTNAPRFLFNDDFNEAEQAEIDRLLETAKIMPLSAGMPRRQSRARSGRCGSRRC
jgi:hypothetical protein